MKFGSNRGGRRRQRLVPAWVAVLGLAIAVSAAYSGSAETATFGGPIAAIYPACRGGYRRQGTFYDYTLGRTWTVLVSCGHPEMPRLAIDPGAPQSGELADRGLAIAGPALVPQTTEALSPSPSLRYASATPSPPARPVLAGSRVRLWKQDSQVRIEMAGVALESGGIGVPVRVRMPVGGQVLRGVVRGPGSVELAEGLGFSGGFSGVGQ